MTALARLILEIKLITHYSLNHSEISIKVSIKHIHSYTNMDMFAWRHWFTGGCCLFNISTWVKYRGAIAGLVSEKGSTVPYNAIVWWFGIRNILFPVGNFIIPSG